MQGKRVLDVGCGGGILADAMARRKADVLGIDLAAKALKVAQLHALEAGTHGVRYQEISAEALAAEQPASFDVVTCMEMLEHVPDPSSVVRACSALLKADGRIFFLDNKPERQGFYVRHSRCRVRAEFVAARDTRVRQTDQTQRTRCILPIRRADIAAKQGHAIQPLD